MQDGADHRHGVVQFEVPVRVPTEAGNTIARLDAEFDERVRKLRDPAPEVGVGITVQRAVV